MVDDDAPRSFASPACFLHEVDPVYAGLANPPDLRDASWSSFRSCLCQRSRQKKRAIRGRIDGAVNWPRSRSDRTTTYEPLVKHDEL